MARLQRPRYYGRTQIATASSTITTTQPGLSIITNGLPTGDMLSLGIQFRLWGNLNLDTASAGTLVTDGEKMFLRSLSIETDKHGIIAQGLDGISLADINQFEFGPTVAATAVSAATTGTPAYAASLRFPFQMQWGNAKRSIRPYDTALDMLLARMTIKAQLGIVTDFITGGTYTTETVQVANVDLDGQVVDNPVTAPADASLLPQFQRSLDIIKVPITATATGYRISLPYGDRIYNRIYVMQRNTSTLARLATVITSTGLVGVAVNGTNIMDPTPLASIQDRNKADYGIATMPSGVACLDFGQSDRIPDFLNVNTRQNGTLELVADVTSVSNGALYLGIDSIKPIPDQARRAVAA